MKERWGYSALRLQELFMRSCIPARHCSTWLKQSLPLNNERRQAKTQWCYCPRAIVPPKMVRKFVCFMPLNRALQLPCKVYVFGDGWRWRSMNGSPEWAQACPSAVHSILCWVKVAVCNAGKQRTTALITQLVSYWSSLYWYRTEAPTKLGSRLRCVRDWRPSFEQRRVVRVPSWCTAVVASLAG